MEEIESNAADAGAEKIILPHTWEGMRPMTERAPYMSENTDRLIKTFAWQLRHTSEYLNYMNKRARIEADPDRLKRANEYRRARFLMQRSREDLFERQAAFERENDDIHKDPVIEEYLEAEVTLCRMIQEAYVQIYAAIDIDIEI